jgi:hypothetical protein
MKTRELLTCKTKHLEAKIHGLKAKTLRRHIDHIAADLGASDTDALLGQILDATLGLAHPLEGEGDEGPVDEAKVILRALEDQIDITGENKETVLRLIVIALAYLRQLMQGQILETHRARRAGHSHERHHHEGHHCDDPNCTEHRGAHGVGHRAEPGTPIPGVPTETD